MRSARPAGATAGCRPRTSCRWPTRSSPTPGNRWARCCAIATACRCATRSGGSTWTRSGGTGSTQHETAGLGTAGNRVQWNSGNSDGVWFAIDGEGQATDTSPDIRAYVGTTLQNTNTGIYVGGTDTLIRRNSHSYYANVFPGGQTIPVAQAQTGDLATGTVGFAWRDVVVNKTGNVIDWFIDGLKIASVTNTLSRRRSMLSRRRMTIPSGHLH